MYRKPEMKHEIDWSYARCQGSTVVRAMAHRISSTIIVREPKHPMQFWDLLKKAAAPTSPVDVDAMVHGNGCIWHLGILQQ